MITTAIVLAAGRGQRFGGEVPKAFLKIAGKTLLAHSIERLRSSEVVKEIVVVIGKADCDRLGSTWQEQIQALGADRVVIGGLRRQDSSLAGFEATQERTEIVLIHDAARPFASPALIRKVCEEAAEHGAAVPALQAVDSVKEGVGGFLVRSIPRSVVYLTQTPQAFRRSHLARMFNEVVASDLDVSDDAEMAEIAGVKVRIVPGERTNLKITTKEDLLLAELIYQRLVG